MSGPLSTPCVLISRTDTRAAAWCLLRWLRSQERAVTALMARSAATAVRSIRRQGEPSHVAGALMLSSCGLTDICADMSSHLIQNERLPGEFNPTEQETTWVKNMPCDAQPPCGTGWEPHTVHQAGRCMRANRAIQILMAVGEVSHRMLLCPRYRAVS